MASQKSSTEARLQYLQEKVSDPACAFTIRDLCRVWRLSPSRARQIITAYRRSEKLPDIVTERRIDPKTGRNRPYYRGEHQLWDGQNYTRSRTEDVISLARSLRQLMHKTALTFPDAEVVHVLQMNMRRVEMVEFDLKQLQKRTS